MVDNERVGSPRRDPDANQDPLTGEAGSHPLGTGVGSAGGAAAGAAVGGVLGGPVGAAVGGAVGAVAGAAAGHAAGEAMDPTGQPDRPGGAAMRIEVRPGLEFDDSEPAYRYGWETATLPEYRDREFEEAERDLERGWPAREGASCEWPAARESAHRAWDRARREGSVSTRQGGDE